MPRAARASNDEPAAELLAGADQAVTAHASALWPQIAFSSNGGSLSWQDGPTEQDVTEAFADWQVMLQVQAPEGMFPAPLSARVPLVSTHRTLGAYGLTVAAHALTGAALAPVTAPACRQWARTQRLDRASVESMLGPSAALVAAAAMLLELHAGTPLDLDAALEWLSSSGWDLASALHGPT